MVTLSFVSMKATHTPCITAICHSWQVIKLKPFYSFIFSYSDLDFELNAPLYPCKLPTNTYPQSFIARCHFWLKLLSQWNSDLDPCDPICNFILSPRKLLKQQVSLPGIFPDCHLWEETIFLYFLTMNLTLTLVTPQAISKFPMTATYITSFIEICHSWM